MERSMSSALDRWITSTPPDWDDDEYSVYLAEIDETLEEKLGLTLSEIEDMPTRIWFEEGVEYDEAVAKILATLGIEGFESWK